MINARLEILFLRWWIADGCQFLVGSQCIYIYNYIYNNIYIYIIIYILYNYTYIIIHLIVGKWCLKPVDLGQWLKSICCLRKQILIPQVHWDTQSLTNSRWTINGLVLRPSCVLSFSGNCFWTECGMIWPLMHHCLSWFLDVDHNRWWAVLCLSMFWILDTHWGTGSPKFRSNRG